MQIFFIAAIIVAYLFQIHEGKKVPDGQVTQEPLSSSLKLWVWVICFFNPVYGGAIFYYGWKKKMPVMAKQANNASLIIFLLQIVSGFILLYFGVPPE
ncbi:MAG: hypothetical protein ACI9BF_000655 [Candidatus Paceibacteria bacterium]|jgi:hypothetical protein